MGQGMADYSLAGADLVLEWFRPRPINNYDHAFFMDRPYTRALLEVLP